MLFGQEADWDAIDDVALDALPDGDLDAAPMVRVWVAPWQTC
ncbi:hypothetical protein [Cellulomonas fengjieae]|nr:hypothetical protein [Cellulomonas fengjieae]